MTLTIKFSTDNARFADDFAGEVSLVLEKAARAAERYGRTNFEAMLLDGNGNVVGSIVASDAPITETVYDENGPDLDELDEAEYSVLYPRRAADEADLDAEADSETRHYAGPDL